MSIERELLQRCLDEFEYKGVACNELCIDINKLLAQPERTEHWKETLIEHFQSAFDSEMYRTDEGEELILLEDAICYVEEFTPPKRKSLGLEIADVCGSEDYREGFKDGALYAEKCHGIGGG
jgi:hypothetical protein